MNRPQIGKAFATAFSGGGLHVAMQEDDWNILLRRLDFLHDDAFARHFGNEIYGRDVAVFLPSWRTLKWKITPPNLLVKTEVYANDVDYMVDVIAEYRS